MGEEWRQVCLPLCVVITDIVVLQQDPRRDLTLWECSGQHHHLPYCGRRSAALPNGCLVAAGPDMGYDLGWGMVRPGHHALSPFGADVPCSAMNSMPPMQSVSTPTLKVYRVSINYVHPEAFHLCFHPSCHRRCVRFGVGGLSVINSVAGCEHAVHIVGTPLTTAYV